MVFDKMTSISCSCNIMKYSSGIIILLILLVLERATSKYYHYKTKVFSNAIF